MNKIFLIIRREYLTRVRKRSFIIMTILGPLLFGSLIIVPALIGNMSDETRVVAVVDESGAPGESIFYPVLEDTEKLKFDFRPESFDTLKANFEQTSYYALLYIPQYSVEYPELIRIESDQKVNFLVLSHISNALEKEIEKRRLRMEIEKLNLGEGYEDYDKTLLENTKVKLNLSPRDITTGESSGTEISMIIGIVGGLMIYFFIFMFGSQVMRGVIEEKTSRIVEVIVSSVKPFQLMMGKILGLALVGLTQFVLWMVLTVMIILFAGQAYPEYFKKQAENAPQMEAMGVSMAPDAATMPQAESQAGPSFNIFSMLEQIPAGLIFFSFLFYFLFGYLMYASLFGAIGSAVDSEADTQQFMLPVTIPLILSIVMLSFIMNNPNGPVAFWLSIIPLTSPVVMMIRVPFDPPVFDIVLSMALLVLAWLGFTWMAGKIYRTGILMYGKKASWGEMIKWLRYRG